MQLTAAIIISVLILGLVISANIAEADDQLIFKIEGTLEIKDGYIVLSPERLKIQKGRDVLTFDDPDIKIDCTKLNQTDLCNNTCEADIEEDE